MLPHLKEVSVHPSMSWLFTILLCIAIGVISFSQESAWNSEFGEALSSQCGAQCDPQLDAITSPESIREKLSNDSFDLLCIVGGDEDVLDLAADSVQTNACMCLLRHIKSSQDYIQYRHKIVVLSFSGEEESVKEEEWWTWITCKHRRAGNETASIVCGRTISSVTLVNGSAAWSSSQVYTTSQASTQCNTPASHRFTGAVEDENRNSNTPRSFPGRRRKWNSKPKEKKHEKKHKSDRDLAVMDDIARGVHELKGMMSQREASDREMRELSVDTNKTAHDTQASVDFLGIVDKNVYP